MLRKEEYLLGRTGEFECLGKQNDNGLELQVYLNKRRNRLEYWHINPDGEYFVKVGDNVYVGVKEKRKKWMLDETKRLFRRGEFWVRASLSHTNP